MHDVSLKSSRTTKLDFGKLNSGLVAQIVFDCDVRRASCKSSESVLTIYRVDDRRDAGRFDRPGPIDGSKADPGQALLVNLGYGCTPNSISTKQKPPGFAGRFFRFTNQILLFAVAEAPRPPSRTAGLGVGCCLGSGLGRGGSRRWLGLAAINRCRCIRLAIDQEAHLFAYG